MHDLYLSAHVPPWLDDEAVRLLGEGCTAFARYELAHTSILERGRETVVLPCRSHKIMNTLAVLLQACGVAVEQDGVALIVAGRPAADLRALCANLAVESVPDTRDVPVKQLDEHDDFLGEDLLAQSYAARLMDVAQT